MLLRFSTNLKSEVYYCPGCSALVERSPNTTGYLYAPFLFIVTTSVDASHDLIPTSPYRDCRYCYATFHPADAQRCYGKLETCSPEPYSYDTLNADKHELRHFYRRMKVPVQVPPKEKPKPNQKQPRRR